jgi:hypothetical protein
MGSGGPALVLHIFDISNLGNLTLALDLDSAQNCTVPEYLRGITTVHRPQDEARAFFATPAAGNGPILTRLHAAQLIDAAIQFPRIND